MKYNVEIDENISKMLREDEWDAKKEFVAFFEINKVKIFAF